MHPSSKKHALVSTLLLLLVGGCPATAADRDGGDAERSRVAAPPDLRAPDGRFSEASASDAERDAATSDVTAPADAAADASKSQGPFAVASFNLHCLLDQPTLRLEGIAQEIAARQLDVVGLQENCQTQAAPADNFAAQLAARLTVLTGRPWEQRFAATHVSWSSYEEGIAILAPRGTLVQSSAQALPQGQGPFPRKVLWARLATTRGSFDFYATHLTISAQWTDRLAQVQAVLAFVAQQRGAGLPQVVVGDYNDKDWSGPLQAMRAGPPLFLDSWDAAHPGQAGFTIPSSQPQERIDYIFVDAAALDAWLSVEVIFATPYQGVWLSDHRGVFARFTTH